MSDPLAGFGPIPCLPKSVLVAWRAEERAEAQQARRDAEARAERVEARRSADIAWAAQRAAERGERVDPVAVASGRVAGRSVGEILAEAAAAADYESWRAENDAKRRELGRLNLTGELEPSATRSAPMTPTRRAIERAAERFAAAVSASREAGRRLAELESVVPQLREPVRRTRTRAVSARRPVTADEASRRAFIRMGGQVL